MTVAEVVVSVADTPPPTVTKDPDSILGPYVWNWAAWLGEDDHIDGATWKVTPAGDAEDLVVSRGSVTATTTGTWLERGRVGVTYTVTCSVLSWCGCRDDRSLRVRVRQL